MAEHPHSIPTSGRHVLAAFAGNSSILDLGRQRAATLGACGAYDRILGPDIPDGEKFKTERASIAAQSLLLDRSEALETLISTMPPQNLGDAAVQIAVAAFIAVGLTANENSEDAVAEKAAKIERMLLGILPLVAIAGGLDMEAMGWGELDRMRAQRFAGAELPS